MLREQHWSADPAAAPPPPPPPLHYRESSQNDSHVVVQALNNIIPRPPNSGAGLLAQLRGQIWDSAPQFPSLLSHDGRNSVPFSPCRCRPSASASPVQLNGMRLVSLMSSARKSLKTICHKLLLAHRFVLNVDDVPKNVALRALRCLNPSQELRLPVAPFSECVCGLLARGGRCELESHLQCRRRPGNNCLLRKTRGRRASKVLFDDVFHHATDAPAQGVQLERGQRRKEQSATRSQRCAERALSIVRARCAQQTSIDAP